MRERWLNNIIKSAIKDYNLLELERNRLIAQPKDLNVAVKNVEDSKEVRTEERKASSSFLTLWSAKKTTTVTVPTNPTLSPDLIPENDSATTDKIIAKLNRVRN